MKRILPSTRALRNLLMPVTAAFTLIATPKAQAQFTTGNVVVLQVGDGAATLGTTGTAVILKEFTPAGVAGTTVNMPVTGAHRLVVSGSATSEGLMTLSADSMKLIVSGYDTTTGYAAIAGTAATTVARAIDTVSVRGIPGRAITSAVAFSGTNIRSSTRTTTENYWSSGNGSGIYYMGAASAPVLVSTTTTNNRAILTANGHVYYSTGSGTTPGIYKITGLPIATTTAVSMISASGMSPYGFAINATEDVAYIADDGTLANGGGIQKWTRSGTTWSLAYILVPAAGSPGSRSVIVDWSGTAPTIYCTTIDSRLVKYIDNGTLASSTSAVLSTAGTNTAYRSVAFAPKAAPACTNPVLVAIPAARKCASGGAVTLGVTSPVQPTYAWTGPNSFTATTQSIANLAAGTYAVTATVPGGCSATTTATVIDSANFTAVISSTRPTTFCAGDSTGLYTTQVAGYTYQFNNASGPIPGATGSAYLATVAGVYTVTVVAGPNCTSTSAPITVTVNPRPTPTVTPAGPLTICPKATAVLHGSQAAGQTFQWRRNNTAITFAGTDSLYNVLGTAGIYSVTVTNTATGCAANSNGVVVNLYPAPDTSVSVSNSNNTFCTGSSLTLKANAAGGNTFKWANTAGPIANATDSFYVATTAGAYRLIITSANGCTDTSGYRTITESAAPVATITTSSDTACQRSLITVNGSTGTGYTYQWQYHDTTIATTQSTFPITAVTFGGPSVLIRDSIRLIVTNGAGCTDTSAWKTLVFLPLPRPIINYAGGMLSTTGTYASYQWIYEGVNIQGATNATYAPSVNGNYNVLVTDANGCTDTALLMKSVSGLSIKNPLASGSEIRVFPNPPANSIAISAPVLVNVQLRDMQGRVVLSAADAKTVDISKLANGIYSVVITDKGGAFLKTTRLTKTGQ